MPTYRITSIAERFSPEQKRQLAKALTGINSSMTGSPPYLVQVIFSEVPSENYFVGGKEMSFDTIFVEALIREGRSADVKEHLINQIMHFTAAIGETDKSAINVYVIDVPASQIAEWGRLLPQLGEEAKWDVELPPDIRRRIEFLSK